VVVIDTQPGPRKKESAGAQRLTDEFDMSRIFPPPQDAIPTEQMSFRFPKQMPEEMDGIAKERRETRSAVLVHLLRFAVDEWRHAEGAEKEKILPPPPEQGPWISSSALIPKELIALFQSLSEERGDSRNDVALHFLRYGLKKWRQEREEEKKETRKKK
jgi:metal-responsive CopG/Arc/MetJ family transcriptional regulator